MADRKKLVRDIKTGGSMAIYIGTASILRPIVKEQNQGRNGFTKLCSIFSGTVISCGISAIASKWFGGVVDKIAEFVDDIKPEPKSKDGNKKG